MYVLVYQVSIARESEKDIGVIVKSIYQCHIFINFYDHKDREQNASKVKTINNSPVKKYFFKGGVGERDVQNE